MKKRQQDKELKKMWEFSSKIEWYLKTAREEWINEWKAKIEELEEKNRFLQSKINNGGNIMRMFKITSNRNKEYTITWKDCIKLADAVLEELEK